jgi:uncharacterized membrane protein
MFLKLYFIAILIFFAIDMVWLGFIAKDFYRSQIGFLLREDVNWFAAILFYLLFVFGLVLFVIAPAFHGKMWTEALWKGALFGLITYATYDLTNQATVKNWPVLVTVIDLIWGTFLASAVATGTYFIAGKLLR